MREVSYRPWHKRQIIHVINHYTSPKGIVPEQHMRVHTNTSQHNLLLQLGLEHKLKIYRGVLSYGAWPFVSKPYKRSTVLVKFVQGYWCFGQHRHLAPNSLLCTCSCQTLVHRNSKNEVRQRNRRSLEEDVNMEKVKPARKKKKSRRPKLL